MPTLWNLAALSMILGLLIYFVMSDHDDGGYA